VRQSQLTLLDDSGTPISDIGSPSPGTSTATTPDEGGKSRSRLSRCVNINPLIFFIVIYVPHILLSGFLLIPLSFSLSNETVVLRLLKLCNSLS
jgi:hypothetical protein